jgi:hypothetical protein
MRLHATGAAYHEFDDVDAKVFVNHRMKAYARARQVIKHVRIRGVDGEVDKVLSQSTLSKGIS